MSRFNNLSSSIVDQGGNHQQAPSRQPFTAKINKIDEMRDLKSTRMQKMNSQSQQQANQLQQQSKAQVEPRAVEYSSTKADTGDCIPKASVRSLISRFS